MCSLVYRRDMMLCMYVCRCVMMLSAALHRMRVWPVSSLQMVSSHDWPLHSMRTAGMFSNRVTTSQGSIQVLRNAWNLVASGVMLLFNVLLLNVFLYTVTLCVLTVPMSVTIRMYICIGSWSFSGTSTPLCVVPPPAGTMWTTVWPPLWGLDNVLDVTLLKRVAFHMGKTPIMSMILWQVILNFYHKLNTYMCMPQWLSNWCQILFYWDS